MAAKLSAAEWGLIALISEAYALPDSPTAADANAFNRLLRSRVPPRGARFTHDHHDTCAYIARSKNANVVAYTANLTSDTPAATAAGTGSDAAHHHAQSVKQYGKLPAGTVAVASGAGQSCNISVESPLHAYFVNLEPSYLAARRKKGVQGDCDDLKMFERRFAYGANFRAVDADHNLMQQLPSQVKHDSRLYAALAAQGDGTATVLSALQAWWMPLTPMAGSFVALPDWPVLLLILHPLSSSAPGEVAVAASPDGPWCADADTLPVMLATIDGKLSVLEKVYVKTIEHWFRLPTVVSIEVYGVNVADGAATYEKRVNDGSHQAPPEATKEELAEMSAN